MIAAFGLTTTVPAEAAAWIFFSDCPPAGHAPQLSAPRCFADRDRAVLGTSERSPTHNHRYKQEKRRCLVSTSSTFRISAQLSLDSRKQVAALLRSACLKNGFFYAANTITGLGKTEAVVAAGRQFFSLPEATKLAVSKGNSSCGRGYERMGSQRLETGAQFDRKKGFVLGTDLPPQDPRVLAGWPQHGENQ